MNTTVRWKDVHVIQVGTDGKNYNPFDKPVSDIGHWTRLWRSNLKRNYSFRDFSQTEISDMITPIGTVTKRRGFGCIGVVLSQCLRCLRIKKFCSLFHGQFRNIEATIE